MERDALVRWCERGILGFALAILVLMPLAFGGRPQMPIGSFLDFWLLDPFILAQWLMLPVLALWLLRLWIEAKPKLLWPPICWAVAAFLVYAVARYAIADIEYVARQELIHVLVYGLLFFVVLNNLHRQEATQLITLTLVFLAMAVALYAVYQFLSGSNRVWHTLKPYPHRGSGTFICPNHLGGFLEMLLPLALACTFTGRFKPLTKVFLGYASLIIVAGIAVTVSRGSWISSLLALLGFFGVLMTRRAYRLPVIVLLVIVLGTAIFVIPKSETFQVRTKQLYAYGKLDDDARFALWQPALEIWRQNPWFGAGPAHYDWRFRQFRPEAVQVRPDRAHNDFLNLLADWGSVGFCLVLAAWVALGFGVWKSWRFVRNSASDLGGKHRSSKFSFVLGAATGLAAILFHSVVDFNMYIPANALLAVTLMALLSSHLRFATDRYWFTAAVWSKALATVFIVAGIMYLGRQSWRHAVENSWLARAARVETYSLKQAELLKKAFAADPMNGQTAQDIGEILQIQSEDGGPNYTNLALQAIDWFTRAGKLNPWDGDSDLGCGWCLDWLGRSTEAEPYFDRAERLDPNSYFTMAKIGVHYIQTEDFAAAKPWLERSLRLQPQTNQVATAYLKITLDRLLSAATNQFNPTLPQASAPK